ncbi:MAG: flagellar biosynthetic protein FliP [Rhodobacteraceae bacterium]|nr:MAG: flagellar biosynthetic protein FliP [Paracoccaceae bacterium]
MAPSIVFAQDLGADLLQTLSGVLSDAPEGSDERASLSGNIIQLIVLMTVLSVAPGLLVVMTSFTRFIIVFSVLRSALGLNQTPPNIVLTSMALFMTFFVMQPVFEDAWSEGVEPLLNNSITEVQAFPRVAEPFKLFMFANTRPVDIMLFRDIAAQNSPTETATAEEPQSVDDVGWRELVPAFMISELRQAFYIGFLIYLPFVAIDLIVASVLMAAGMMMMPPVLISLPFKVIFFVLIDGWYMLAGSLMESYIPYAGTGL